MSNRETENPWRYFRNGKWEALPEEGRACDLSLCPNGPYIESNLRYASPEMWLSLFGGSRRTATNDFEVYAWRYHEAVEPAPVPKDDAP